MRLVLIALLSVGSLAHAAPATEGSHPFGFPLSPSRCAVGHIPEFRCEKVIEVGGKAMCAEDGFVERCYPKSSGRKDADVDSTQQAEGRTEEPRK